MAGGGKAMEKNDCWIFARTGLPIKYIDSTKIYFVKLHLHQFLPRQAATGCLLFCCPNASDEAGVFLYRLSIFLRRGVVLLLKIGDKGFYIWKSIFVCDFCDGQIRIPDIL